MEDLPELDIAGEFSLLGLVGYDDAEFIIYLCVGVATNASEGFSGLVDPTLLNIPRRRFDAEAATK